MLHSAYHHVNSTLHTMLEDERISGIQRQLVCRHLQVTLTLKPTLTLPLPLPLPLTLTLTPSAATCRGRVSCRQSSGERVRQPSPA